MMRLAIAAGTILLGSTGAMAACSTLGPEPSGVEQAFDTFTDLLVTGTGSASCDIVGAIPTTTPVQFVVYQVNARGSAFMDDVGATGSFAFTNESDSEIVNYGFVGGDEEPIFIRRKYAAGLNPSAFDGDYEVIVDGNGEVAIDQIFVSAATTTLAEQEESLASFGQQQAGIVTHLDGITNLLTGGNIALEGDNEVGVLGGLGSFTLGATARMNLADGFSVLAGGSIVDFSLPGASATGLTGAATLRYVQPDDGGGFRLLGEVGGQLSALGFSLSREYDDGLSVLDQTSGGTGTGWLGVGHLRGGVALTPMAGNELVLSASLKQGIFAVGSFVEDDPETEPDAFTADLSGTAVGYTTIRGGADWTTELADDLDLTASAALGTTFGNSGVSADVFGVSDITGENVDGAAGSTVFVEYGLRLGWTPSPGKTIDGFVHGTTGTGIGTHAQIGAAYRMSF